MAILDGPIIVKLLVFPFFFGHIGVVNCFSRNLVENCRIMVEDCIHYTGEMKGRYILSFLQVFPIQRH